MRSLRTMSLLLLVVFEIDEIDVVAWIWDRWDWWDCCCFVVEIERSDWFVSVVWWGALVWSESTTWLLLFEMWEAIEWISAWYSIELSWYLNWYYLKCEKRLNEYQRDIRSNWASIWIDNVVYFIKSVVVHSLFIIIFHCYFWQWMRRDVGIRICEKINYFTNHLIRQHISVS